MSDIIKILPTEVSNKIAAGEVVQRPASVVKELLENSIDAESTKIKLVVKDSGKTLIQVVDNGVGMTKNDMKMSFENHATSKIKNIDDVFSITSMGFRGEALASISSISNIEMISKKKGTDKTNSILLGGDKVSIEKAVFEGSNIEARGNMLLGAMLAGKSFANSPVAAVHALAYPIGGTFHVSHGLSNSLVLPYVLRFNSVDATTTKNYAEFHCFLGMENVKNF